jgi:general secretion pathway protein A
MDERHFGFTTDPFSLASDPTIFYRSRQHWMAESFLEYAMESQGVISLLTGDVGCGKSLLVSRLLNKLGDTVTIGLINRPHGRLQWIHDLVASSLGIEHRGESDSAIYEMLASSFQRDYTRGRRTLLIIDEAQNLSVEILEELRLLSNVNSRNNFLQILLVGQPELRKKLIRPELLQIAQRISAQFHLSPLKSFETHAYIRFRLQAVGANPSMFTARCDGLGSREYRRGSTPDQSTLSLCPRPGTCD